MKPTAYKVYFMDGYYESVNAFGLTQAMILAQAKRINDAKDYEVHHIEED